MSDGASPALAEALLALRLCVADPRLGGLLLRGPARAWDGMIEALAATMPAGAPIRRLPVTADADALDDGIDVAAALAGQGRRTLPGLLARTAGGALVVPLAGQLAPEVAARIAAALDRGTPLAVVAIEDEGGAGVPAALAERLAFHLDPGAAAPAPVAADAPVTVAAAVTTIAEAAAMLGVASARADLLALRTARALAVAAGQAAPTEGALAQAVRLVLLPRATRLPATDDAAPAPPPPPPSPEQGDGGDTKDGDTLAERVLDAARAAIDPALLERLAAGLGSRREGSRARGAGERRRARTRGRRAGTRAALPIGGARLAIAATVRAAAPWQAARGRTDRVLLRRGDLHVHRFQARAEPLTIFAVDASGSAAMARLAETKGAVELLLSQAYVQRAEVALVAFRGAHGELVVPPTRSLTRARRLLAELPGGGGTPLAGGIAAAHALALAARARGQSPALVLLSDGRGNVALDGSGGRAAAERDALAAARAFAADRFAAVFVDTGARPRPEGARLAEALRADYVPLPYADAAAIGAAAARIGRG